MRERPSADRVVWSKVVDKHDCVFVYYVVNRFSAVLASPTVYQYNVKLSVGWLGLGIKVLMAVDVFVEYFGEYE